MANDKLEQALKTAYIAGHPAEAAALLGAQSQSGRMVPVLLLSSSFLMISRLAWRLVNAGNLSGDPGATSYHDKVRCG